MMFAPLSRRQAIEVVTTPLTSEASEPPRNSIAALLPEAGLRCTNVKLASFMLVRGVWLSSAFAESCSIIESGEPLVFCTPITYWMVPCQPVSTSMLSSSAPVSTSRRMLTVPPKFSKASSELLCEWIWLICVAEPTPPSVRDCSSLSPEST